MTHEPMLEGCSLPLGREFIDEEALDRMRFDSSLGRNGHDMSANWNTVWRLVATIDHFRALAARTITSTAEGDARAALAKARPYVVNLIALGEMEPRYPNEAAIAKHKAVLAEIDAALNPSPVLVSEGGGEI